MPSNEQLLKELEIKNKKNFLELKSIITFTELEISTNTIPDERLIETIKRITLTALQLLPKYQEEINPYIAKLANIVPNSISPASFFHRVRNPLATSSIVCSNEWKRSTEEQTLREKQAIINHNNFTTLRDLILSLMRLVETNKAEPKKEEKNQTQTTQVTNQNFTEHLMQTVNDIRRTALEFTPEYQNQIQPLIIALRNTILYKETRPVPPTVESLVLSPDLSTPEAAISLAEQRLFHSPQPLPSLTTAPSTVADPTIPVKANKY